ncbi:MAG TPA: 50S ribosomal protein L10 [Candidatus Nanoarchaeia archaeon]|nr:50S ribosomal protein L10 [Candidatus Nanoarchaeia archaeon]
MVEKKREKAIPEQKVKLVATLAAKIKSTPTVLIASTKGLPSSQFHAIKKNLRGKAELVVAKKSLVIRAIEKAGVGGKELEGLIGSDVAVFFSSMDAFALSALLTEQQSPTKARTGDIAPEDLTVEPGPTDLVPGPAISELSGVGLKVSVEGGKLAIKLPHTLVRAGEVIKENVASVLGKLNILPMKVGFEPLGAYDAAAKKVYVGIKIDKKATLEELQQSIKQAMGLAVARNIVTPETVKVFIVKAAREEKALEAKTQITKQEGSS